jgi:hypothetical protein
MEEIKYETNKEKEVERLKYDNSSSRRILARFLHVNYRYE